MTKALFLDRDGIINVDCAYPHKPEQIKFVDGIFDLCLAALQKGYIIIVVTNQAGVAKGYFTEEDVVKLHEWMGSQFFLKGITISAFYYCPYHPKAVIEMYRKDSDCRKPAPGMILQAVIDFNIDIGKSLMVGDKLSDRIKIPELRTLIVKSKYTDEFDIENLSQVADFL
jgi:D-glycero-D-manno-heptose 1,7-bisphosphate phosphatase